MQEVMNKNTMKPKNNVIPFIPEADFYFEKGVEAFQKEKFEIALKWLKRAVEQKPDEPMYQCQMSIIYTEIGSYHLANQVLTNVLQHFNDYTDCYYFLANNHAHLGLLTDAKKYALTYLEKEPNGDFAGETEILLDLIDIDDDHDDDWDLSKEDELLIYQETVFYHMENMEWDQALPLIEEMMTLFPNHQLTRHDYTQALFFSGDKELAIQKELENLEEDPNSLYSITNLAVFYYELGQLVMYENYIKILQNIFPFHDQQKLRIAVTFARTGMYQEAMARFRLLQKGVVKSHPSYYRWYTIASYQTGHLTKASGLWEEGCRKHPKLSNEEVPWSK